MALSSEIQKILSENSSEFDGFRLGGPDDAPMYNFWPYIRPGFVATIRARHVSGMPTRARLDVDALLNTELGTKADEWLTSEAGRVKARLGITGAEAQRRLLRLALESLGHHYEGA